MKAITLYLSGLSFIGAACGCARHETSSQFSAAGSPPGAAAAQAPVGQPIDYIDIRREDQQRYCSGFWRQPNDDTRWTNDRNVVIEMGFSTREASELRIMTGAFLVPGKLSRQRVNVFIDDKPVGRLEITEPSIREYRLALPRGVWTGHSKLRFELPDATAPLKLGTGDDDRTLALAVQSVSVRAN